MQVDAEYGPANEAFNFSEESIRKGFVRKVYSILMLQLSVTMGFIAVFLFHNPTTQFVKQHYYLMFVAMVVVLVMIVSLACCGNARRRAPLNYILLLIFTLAESFLTGTITSFYETNIVLIAGSITIAVCLGLTIFAFQTKFDFTLCGGVLIASTIILFIFGILTIFIHNHILNLVYASLGAFIFSIYLVLDTQMMIGGKHKYTISPEEYIFAAMNIYVDIVNIFLYILTLFGNR